ncbi:iron ABC transporter permease [Cellulomonas fimi]|uniref:Iron ABC transporter permease n=1 Tax=Cellulomonas fimi TaxID=1708 RepID=A0A7Y0M025_CELFI|nr:iron ABC transporter permease [Cellulomonas fimi]NMR21069.1 iron ABC transporter permease [Cellulomonas fimi]
MAGAVALLPLVYLVIRASEGGAATAVDVLLRERTFWLVARSVGLAAAVTAACVVVGVTLAWLTTRTDLPGRRTFGVLAALPLAVPSYVAAYAWISALPGLAGFWGTFLVMTACTYPYVYLPVVAALRRTDPALEEVSRSLGRSARQTFLAVTVRQVRPAAAAGALLVALYVLSDFGAPSLLRYDVFTRVIHASYRSSFDRTPAALLSLLLVALTIAITVAESRSRGRASQARVGGGVARVAATVRLGAWRGPAVGACVAVAAVALAFPAASLTFWLVRGSSAAFEPGRLVAAGLATAGVSVLGALLTTTLAVPVGVLVARFRGRGVRTLEHATFAGHALPGIVVALSLVFFGVRFARPVYQETPLLVVAYAVLFLPAAVGAVRASVALSPRRLEEVSRSLGHGPWSSMRRVTLPLAGPGVAAGAALVLLSCMKELPATLLLRPTGMDTLATRLWTETGTGAYAAAAPYAVLLVLLAAVPTFLLTTAHARLGRDPAVLAGTPPGAEPAPVPAPALEGRSR